MASHDRDTEELLAFLLTRLDETGFASLVDHEPKRVAAGYIETAGGRAEQRARMLVVCVTCSRTSPLFPRYYPLEGVAPWPCRHVRSLALRFAGDPEFQDWWRPAR